MKYSVVTRRYLVSAQRILFLACACLLLPRLTPAATPALVNAKAFTLPAEVLLTWDAWPDAASYGVYRANTDLRWTPIAKGVLSPRYRDGDFQTLPCYYQVAAYNSAGELAAFAQLSVPAPFPPPIGAPVGVNPRPISDTSFAVEWNMVGAWDGLLEVGASPTNYEWAAWNTNYTSRQEFIVANLLPATTYFYRLTSTRPGDGIGFSYRNSFATRPFVETPVNLSIPTPDGLPAIVTTDEDVPVHFVFAAVNPNGAEITYAVATGPINGGSLLGTLPDVLFVPKPEGDGSDIFRVTATDGLSLFSTSVQVQVRPVHDAPIAHEQSATLDEDTGAKFQLLATSTDGDPTGFEFLIVDAPTNGVLGRALYDPPSYVQYIPNTNFNGIDHFTFVAADGQSTGNVATVRIRVLPVPDPPTAAAQTVSVFRGGPTNITLAVGDVDNDSLVLSILTSPKFGSVTGNGLYQVPPLTVVYTPAGGPTNNTDSFTYRVLRDTAISATATATVTINLVPPYFPPIAYNSTFNTGSNQPVPVPMAAAAPGGGALTYVLRADPVHGALSGTMPALTYTPAPGFYGMDGFIFVASDGLSFTAPATNTIMVWGPVPPLAPSGLAASAVSQHQIDLRWLDNAFNEDGFQIESSEDNRHWKRIALVPKNTVSYSNVKLPDNKLLYYRVRAVNRYGVSDYSNTASARTWK